MSCILKSAAAIYGFDGFYVTDSIDCSIYGVMANQQLGLMVERMVTLAYDAIWLNEC